MSDVFELSKTDLTQSEKFRFKVPGKSKVWEVPNMNRLPVGVKLGLAEAAEPIAEARKRGRQPSADAAQKAATAQMKLLERLCPGLLDLVDEEQVAELMKAWAEHSGITAGE